MSMNLINLDMVKELMLDEINLDERENRIYLSKFMPSHIKGKYIQILRNEIQNGSDITLGEKITQLLLSTSPLSGRTKPWNAHVTFSEGEFNRFYIRGVCRKAIELGKKVIVYRAKKVANPRHESQAKIGLRIDPEVLLNDLRIHQGVDTALGLPAGPNSGLSVKLEE
jgi:hypothetical protein